MQPAPELCETRPETSSSSTAPATNAEIVSIRTGQRLDPVTAECRRRDQLLVADILAGEGDAFTRLHDLYGQRLFRFAVKRLGDPVEAEDVVQDTFLEVHRCLSSWEGRSALLTWMFGIAHHQICRRFRRKTPIGMSMEELEVHAPAAAESSHEGRVEAIRVLEVCADVLDETVSPAQKEIFDLYYGENRGMKEIADTLGKSNQAVKISLFRTRRAMEARLESDEWMPASAMG